MELDSLTRAARGTHRRITYHVAFVGPLRCSTDWALATTMVRNPHSAHRTISVTVDDDVEAAKARALAHWQGDPDGTDAILLWPTEQWLRWDAILQLTAPDGPERARIGEAAWSRRDTGAKSVDRPDLCGTPIAPEAVEFSTPRLEPTPGTAAPQAPPHMVIGVPTLGTTSLLWTAHLQNLELPFGTRTSALVVSGLKVAEARQAIVDSVLAMDPRPPYLCFLGDDMLPPPNGLRVLCHEMLSQDIPAISGLYVGRSLDPPMAFLWKHGHPGLLIPGKDFSIGDLLAVDGCGLDFCVIATDRVATLPRPMFASLEDRHQSSTEDCYFWNRFADANRVKPVVDTAVVVGHFDARTEKVHGPSLGGARPVVRADHPGRTARARAVRHDQVAKALRALSGGIAPQAMADAEREWLDGHAEAEIPGP